jgi:phosphotransferase system enzyme I (PtsI)
VYEKFIKELNIFDSLPAITEDKQEIDLYCNIEIPDELKSVKSHNADGIGLYRTEFIFLEEDNFPSENDQYRQYFKVAKMMYPAQVVIRTMDLGGDKLFTNNKDHIETNPFLGWRSIRFCLANLNIFKTQLRAIFRASELGNISIMFPMIAIEEEVDKIHEIVEEVKIELRNEKIAFSEDVKLGIMIEIPSAVMVADNLAKKVDFFSIGTNDLVQYTIAVDRGNEKVSYLYSPVDPAILKLIQMTIDSACRNKIEVSMCGEMAGHPLYTRLLLGMGLKKFSMAAWAVPEIKKIIRSSNIADVKKLAKKAFKINKASDIKSILVKDLQDNFPEFDNKIPGIE